VCSSDLENFISLINRLAGEFPVGFVISIGPQDSDLRERLLASIRCEYLILDHRPLREVAAVIDQIDYFLSNDTGIMHIAGAVRTHLLALFGPSDPLQWMPPGRKNRFLHGSSGAVSSIAQEDVYRELRSMFTETPLCA
jgi:ADP-heptose:LPS heptosyltransferase